MPSSPQAPSQPTPAPTPSDAARRSVRVLGAHAVILAGGRGTRMGGLDKGLVSHRGQPFVVHAAQWLRPQVSSLVVSANRNLEHYQRLGFETITDAWPGFIGPLAGVHAALQHCPQPVLAVVPCDSFGMSADLIGRMNELLVATGADAVHPVWRDRERSLSMEPLPCLVRRSLLPHLEDYLEAAQSGAGCSVRQWLGRLNAAPLELGHEELFFNINSLEDLDRLVP